MDSKIVERAREHLKQCPRGATCTFDSCEFARAVIAMADVAKLAASCQERIGVDERDSQEWRDLADALRALESTEKR